jgi:hypothetical protein
MEESPVVLRGVDKENNPGCQGNIKHLRALLPVLQPLVSRPISPPSSLYSHHSQIVHDLLAGNWLETRAAQRLPTTPRRHSYAHSPPCPPYVRQDHLAPNRIKVLEEEEVTVSLTGPLPAQLAPSGTSSNTATIPSGGRPPEPAANRRKYTASIHPPRPRLPTHPSRTRLDA